MPNINHYSPQSGRRIKEDGTTVNIADAVDKTSGAFKTVLTGSNVPDAQAVPMKKTVKKIVSTLANAVSLGAGATSSAFLLGADGTESEVWLAISIDQQPWTARGNNDFSGDWNDAFYPIKNGVTSTYLATTPTMCLALGMLSNAAVGGGLTSFSEAKSISQPLTASSYVKITNSSASTATLTIRAIRIWR